MIPFRPIIAFGVHKIGYKKIFENNADIFFFDASAMVSGIFRIFNVILLCSLQKKRTSVNSTVTGRLRTAVNKRKIDAVVNSLDKIADIFTSGQL